VRGKRKAKEKEKERANGKKRIRNVRFKKDAMREEREGLAHQSRKGMYR
jgi:hypothetical protein